MPKSIELPDEGDRAAEELLRLSGEGPVLVFKKSPICPVSFAAEAEWRAFLEEADADLSVVEIDVLARKPLARGLVAALGIRHESPQALLAVSGRVVWHDSHGSITRESLSEALADSKGG